MGLARIGGANDGLGINWGRRMEKLAMRIRVGVLSFVLAIGHSARAFCMRFVAMFRLRGLGSRSILPYIVIALLGKAKTLVA